MSERRLTPAGRGPPPAGPPPPNSFHPAMPCIGAWRNTVSNTARGPRRDPMCHPGTVQAHTTAGTRYASAMAAMDGESLPMPIAALAIDCADPPGLARWWQRLLGGDVEIDDDGVATLRTAHGHVIDFAHVPEKKSGKNRLHLDLRSADLDAATERALALGATRADDVYTGDRWRVLRDPEGNEFCILRPVDDPAR